MRGHPSQACARSSGPRGKVAGPTPRNAPVPTVIRPSSAMIAPVPFPKLYLQQKRAQLPEIRAMEEKTRRRDRFILQYRVLYRNTCVAVIVRRETWKVDGPVASASSRCQRRARAGYKNMDFHPAATTSRHVLI